MALRPKTITRKMIDDRNYLYFACKDDPNNSELKTSFNDIESIIYNALLYNLKESKVSLAPDWFLETNEKIISKLINFDRDSLVLSSSDSLSDKSISKHVNKKTGSNSNVANVSLDPKVSKAGSSAPMKRSSSVSKYSYYLISNDFYSSTLSSKPTRFFIVRYALNYISSCDSSHSQTIFNTVCLYRVHLKSLKGFVVCSYDFKYSPSTNKLTLFFYDSLDKDGVHSLYSNSFDFSLSELKSDKCVKIILNDFELRSTVSDDTKEAK